ncbi:hypothetical protein B0A50_04924 [Salinomyces thailandicus]|uniref:Small ribosomal subunit protein mS41 n=1 Tax=Salinomyces thailandicus TaxID=706561 RepID=A0A4U0TZ31_9PEZI|nr:hypothetical protein B0A50_04924 [Salinomyces thailandica]
MALARPTTTSLFALPQPTRTLTSLQHRALHRLHAPSPRIPKPTPFVPDVPTFLTLIGHNLSSHAAKIPTWEALFTLSGAQLRESGIEPARARRYLLWWRERFRNGITGIGGDLKEVKDGIAELRVVEVPSERKVDQAATVTKGAGMRKMVVNVPASVALPADPAKAVTKEEGEGSSKEGPPAPAGAVALPVDYRLEDAQPVSGLKIIQANIIGGTGVEPVKGYQGVARLKVRQGLWEQSRGHKVDGGERRKAEVRYKRRAQERKMAR